MRTALIIGCSGQDGAYLAQLLLNKGYKVVGTSRDAQTSSFASLVRLGIRDRVLMETMSLTDFRSVIQVLNKVAPDEIYNLAGQSSVGLSFQLPVETFESIGIGCLNLLESLRFLQMPARLYNASSGECFGNTNGQPATELTPFHPRSPYAVAKSAAFWQTANYREAYGLYACSGILFNHESPLRPERFVTRKIIRAVVDIAAGRSSSLSLGNVEIERDWGWAPEFVEAMWRMLQQEKAEDFVIATGRSWTLQEFTAEAFALVGLDWLNYIVSDPGLLRPTDVLVSRADPTRAAERLGWKARMTMPEVVRLMTEAELSYAASVR